MNKTKLIPQSVTQTVLVASRSSGKVPALHIPGPDGTPVCSTVLKRTKGGSGNPEDRWREKDLSVYPEGWRDWCGECCRIVVKEGRKAVTGEHPQPRRADGRFVPYETEDSGAKP